eukprot:796997-Alexandrium_andersonii.AAC.1
MLTGRRSGLLEPAPARRPTGARPGRRLRPQERAGAMTCGAIPPTPEESKTESNSRHCSRA